MSGDDLPSDLPPAAPGSSYATAAGTSFGRFRALHQLGFGSLGPVFRGVDPDTGEPVAIKQFKLQIGPERTRLVIEELQALARRLPGLPNVARVRYAGLHDGDIFMVSELAAGEGLDAALKEYGPAAMTDALPRLAQLAQTLDVLADEGIWHGALHPADIVVSADETRLASMGVAQILEQARVAVTSRPPYAAPEVTARRQSSPAADQYALGAIAHEWLLGVRAPAAGDFAVEIPSLPGADGEALSAALTRAMAADAADRFATCRAFVDAIRDSASVVRPDVPAAVVPHAADRFDADADSPPDPLQLTLSPALAADPDERPEAETPVPWRGQLAAADSVAPASSSRLFGAWTLAAAFLAGVVVGLLGGYTLVGRMEPRAEAPADAAQEGREAAGPNSAQPSAETKGQPFTDTPVATAPQRAESPAREPETASRDSAPAGRRAAATAAAPRVDTARLLVRSTPAGATVTIDGADRGRTPVALRDLSLGTRHVVVTRPGFTPAERRITLTADRPSRSIEVTLSPLGASRPAPARPRNAAAAVGTLLVESRPPGAAVTIDGRPSGTTPLTLGSVTPGVHTVLIELVGYRPVTTTVEVKAGARARVAASLVGGGQEHE